jgi:hypothetical protein
MSSADDARSGYTRRRFLYRVSMNTSRFDYDRRLGVTVDPSAQKHLKWIRVSRIGNSLLRDSGSPGRRRIFAIVAPPMRAN